MKSELLKTNSHLSTTIASPEEESWQETIWGALLVILSMATIWVVL